MGSSLIIKLLCVVLAFVIASFLFYDYVQTKELYKVKQAELLNLSAHLEQQNEAIAKLKVDVEAYKNKKPQIIEKIVTRYEQVEIRDETCEAELETIRQLTKAFFNRKNKGDKDAKPSK